MKNYYPNDKYWMQHVILLAKLSKLKGEIPVGALLILNNKIIGEGHNFSINKKDPTAHAEIITLRKASKKINNYRLLNTIMYVTLEPCIMCIGAIIISRVKRLVFGIIKKKIKKNYYHKIIINNNIINKTCYNQLINFFFKNRKIKII